MTMSKFGQPDEFYFIPPRRWAMRAYVTREMPRMAPACEERPSDYNIIAFCTRRVGHSGPHVAHETSGKAIAWWPK